MRLTPAANRLFFQFFGLSAPGFLRAGLLVFLSAAFLGGSSPSWAQTSTGNGQATVLGQVVNANVGTTPLRTVLLTGNATVYSASGQTSGAITLRAFFHKSSAVELDLPSGVQREIRNGTGIYPSRAWTGPDGVQHSGPLSDLKLPHPAWFFPSFVLLSGLASPHYWCADLGAETWQGVSVRHIAIWQRVPSNLPAPAAAIARQQTQTDFYLDPTTFLPVAMTFHANINPQYPYEVFPLSTTSGDTLVQVSFSNYQAVQGRQIPFSIQVLNGNSQVMSIQISSATVDGGQTPAVSN